ncbi:hypothetical protein UB33_01710, partial [Photobacterium angustum]
MKNYINKSLLIATTAMLVNPMAIASVEVGNGLGVELILNDKFKGTPDASLYTVSHFNNVKSANDVYKANGLTIDLFVDKVVYESYDDTLVTHRLNSMMNANREQFAWQSKPFISVVISQSDTSVLGASTQPESDAEFDPDGEPLYQMGQHRYVTLNKSTMYGSDQTDSNYYTFAHEMGHALGALHEKSDENHQHDVVDEYYANALAASTCLDGSKPLMIANAEFYSKTPLITGTANCPLLDESKNP